MGNLYKAHAAWLSAAHWSRLLQAPRRSQSSTECPHTHTGCAPINMAGRGCAAPAGCSSMALCLQAAPQLQAGWALLLLSHCLSSPAAFAVVGEGTCAMRHCLLLRGHLGVAFQVLPVAEGFYVCFGFSQCFKAHRLHSYVSNNMSWSGDHTQKEGCGMRPFAWANG